MKAHRRSSTPWLLGFSVSYEHDSLLSRGLGWEHLRELVDRLARPAVRRGWSLAYGGNWEPSETSVTYELLRIISSEQEDNSIGGLDSKKLINPMFNHLGWPAYLRITPKIEAEWINVCRIVRIDQLHAGVPDPCDDSLVEPAAEGALLARALCLSAKRYRATCGMAVEVPGIPSVYIPRLDARVFIGGKREGFHGFVPGLAEELLIQLEQSGLSSFLLGGFGGIAADLAELFLSKGKDVPTTLDPNTLSAVEAHLEASWKPPTDPSMFPWSRPPSAILRALIAKAKAADSLAAIFSTGLDEEQTREMMTTSDVNRAVTLVLAGLSRRSDTPLSLSR